VPGPEWKQTADVQPKKKNLALIAERMRSVLLCFSVKENHPYAAIRIFFQRSCQ
jgi:hypothetical protein